ncbi:DUF6193 family natural product biosynthesis protein [Streptomyces sp. NBC_01462]|uniref:DUF6193 family natural product biosynthesis protein n=1 Tax=Streptomyces sp. NBC_01462 TaxID=2903876 RepID=UPI003FCC3C26
MLEGHPRARRGEPAVIEIAYTELRLRALSPFPSHGALTATAGSRGATTCQSSWATRNRASCTRH